MQQNTFSMLWNMLFQNIVNGSNVGAAYYSSCNHSPNNVDTTWYNDMVFSGMYNLVVCIIRKEGKREKMVYRGIKAFFCLYKGEIHETSKK